MSFSSLDLSFFKKYFQDMLKRFEFQGLPNTGTRHPSTISVFFFLLVLLLLSSELLIIMKLVTCLTFLNVQEHQLKIV